MKRLGLPFVGLLLVSPALLSAQPAAPEGMTHVDFEGSPALLLRNDRIELTMLPKGGAFVNLTLRDDATRMSPLWNPARIARETGKKPRPAGGGHFVCVDGFGEVSPEEKAAGLPGHGEAHREPWAITESEKKGGTLSVSFLAELPLVQERFRRTVRMVDGESVVYVESSLESLLGFDRPVFWAEHATIGSPFLDPGKTVVDVSARQSKTRTHIDEEGPYPHRLKDFVEFTWPNAPGEDGKTIDLRVAPLQPNSLDHTTSLMDPERRLVFVTALHTERQLLLGYVFNREEFPWLQCWDNYAPDGDMARGLEFSTQPFDVPRREVLDKGKLFGTSVFRWLPARTTIQSRFLFFYTKVPAGFTRVDDVTLKDGKLLVTDSRAGKTVQLAASRGL
ncbi:MAG: hypothetical protein EXQ52_18240 [Bryobacterales bacterium]|nr:hypothetical protein [Bryobacterales bacterium]